VSDPRWHHDEAVDLSGLKCPLPAILVGKALSRMRPGQRLLATATDPMAEIDIPHACAAAGHHVVARARDGRTLRFLIERGGGVVS